MNVLKIKIKKMLNIFIPALISAISVPAAPASLRGYAGSAAINSATEYMSVYTDYLPDGCKFDFWDCRTVFTKTYYVDNNNPKADDKNDGSEKRPFKTINRAAAVVKVGERVVIREGVYHETIRSVNGGTDAQHMVSFEGQGIVVITGAVKWECDFRPSEGLRQTAPKGERDLFSPDSEKYMAKNGANVYMGEIPADSLQEGINPFSILNLSPVSFGSTEDSVPRILEGKPLDLFNPDPQLKKRGLLFCDGKMMEQVIRPHELWQKKGTYWVDESGKVIHFRLENDSDLKGHILEIAVLEQGFAPDKSGLSYIRLKDLTFEKFSNPFPPPQKGAVSTNCGNHFIIEGCTIRDVNSIGADMGFLSHYNLHGGERGYHIVRNCSFINCGISGLSALPTQGEYLKCMLVEGNTFTGNCWHNTEPIWECAAIKNHYTENSLYRNNLITDTHYGAGIWLDKAIKNTRVCNNIIIGVEHSLFGGILVEATYFKNLVDHNFIYETGYRITPLDVKTGGHGIYLNEVDGIRIYGNIIFNIVGDGVFCPAVTTPRLIGTYDPRATTGSGNEVRRNIIHGCKRAITLPSGDNTSDENVLGNIFDAAFLIRKEKEQLSLEEARDIFGFEKNGTEAKVFVKFDQQALHADITINGNTRSLDLRNTDEIHKYIEELPQLLN